ncbi:hypothetical protein [Minwuia thermotolerans]|uniref:Uncharacterized protein n=1 Tax=Minwuia thermotolerans TaxID=2056226 RepID=A0A2M9G4G9_9PROT|nr:hypothetical protein [Minwuia thermotolerans]PJK30615.1 hypothetical protein CVT23_06640 [Minwuia thermotolerans]
MKEKKMRSWKAALAAGLALIGPAAGAWAQEAAADRPRFSFADMTVEEAIAAPETDLEIVRRPRIAVREVVGVPVRDVRGIGTWRTTLDRVHRLSRAADLDEAALVRALESSADTLPAPYLMEISRRLVAAEAPREGLYWFALGELRTVYDALRCADESVRPNIAATLIELHPVTEEARITAIKHGALYVEALETARDSDALFASRASPWWICSSGLAAMDAARDGRAVGRDDWLKPESAWPAARQATLRHADHRIRNTVVRVGE